MCSSKKVNVHSYINGTYKTVENLIRHQNMKDAEREKM